MPRNIILKITFVVLLMTFCVVAFLGAQKIALGIMEKKIVQGMGKSNYCATHEDCALVMYRCPFGCGTYINKKEMAKISKMVSFYFKLRPRRCVHDCAMPISPVCRQGICVPKPCALNKEYRAQFPDNCSCPPGSVATSKVSPSGQRSFECGARKEQESE